MMSHENSLLCMEYEGKEVQEKEKKKIFFAKAQ